MNVLDVSSKLIPVLTIFGLLSACSEQKEKTPIDGGYAIYGKVGYPTPGDKVVLFEVEGKEVKAVDTTIVSQDSTYFFTGKVPEPLFYKVNIGGKQDVYFILTNEVINIASEGTGMRSKFEVSGTVDNENFNALTEFQAEAGQKMQQFQQEYNLVTEEDMAVLQMKYEDMQRGQVDELKQLIVSMGPSVVAVFSTYYFYNQDEVFGFLDSLHIALKPYLNDSKYYKELGERLDNMRATAIGQEAPDIILTNPNGKIVKLNDFKGRFVVIDFWASWCGPCRKENPFMVKMYQKFRNNGVEFLGVSLDRQREPWVKAIETDKLIWPQVWDETGAAADMYRVQAIPSTFLLDREGKILAKNLRGEQLYQKIEQSIKQAS